MQIIKGSVKAKIEYYQNDRRIEYWIILGNTRRCVGSIDKNRPGWKRVWDETLAALTKTVEEYEGGTGIQSRAFQQSPSTQNRYTLS